MNKIPLILLLMETSRAPAREMMRGIVKYARLHGHWRFLHEPPFYRKALLDGRIKTRRDYTQLLLNKDKDIDGIIGYFANPIQAKELVKHGIPIIALDIDTPYTFCSTVVSDDEKIGVIGAEYLMNIGLSFFAFCGFDDLLWSIKRGEFFNERITKSGKKIELYIQPTSKQKRLWKKEQFYLAEWLKSLPKPIGVMACNDDRGRDISEACKIADIHIPEEVAILGVDNDELVCELCDPPLSSINLNFERAGYEIAELMDKLMRGEQLEPQKIVYASTHIVKRQSTDIIAVNDKEVSQAIKFIRFHAREQIYVDDVVQEVLTSRRNLERKFRRELGRSIYREIRGARVNQIVEMLLETDLSVTDISKKLNFKEIHNLARLFRQEKKMTPMAYRRKYGKK